MITTIHYLGGPIRTSSPELYATDLDWREKIKQTARMKDAKVKFADPAACEDSTFSMKNRSTIIHHRDIALLNISHGGIFNLHAFDTGYPCVGAIFEIGYLSAQGKPCYAFAGQRSKLREHPMLAAVCFLEKMEEIYDIIF